MDAAVSTSPLRLALVGVPNCGKTALFNRLTGSRQKVANYPGVTVERREGERATADGRTLRVLDLPGTYSLKPTTLDEAITRDVLLGRVADVFSTGANDVLTVRGEGTEILIPLLDTVLRSVDLEAGVIVLDPPPGLPGLPESI